MARHSAIIGPSRLIASGAAAALVPALGPGGARAQIVGTGGAQAYARNVGDLEVIALLDGHFPLGGGMMINIDENTVAGALRESYHDLDQPVATGISAFIVRSGDRTVLMDAGAPAAFAPTVNRLFAGLGTADMAPENIDTLLLSHMHPDHIGGMLGEGGPVFTNDDMAWVPEPWQYG